MVFWCVWFCCSRSVIPVYVVHDRGNLFFPTLGSTVYVELSSIYTKNTQIPCSGIASRKKRVFFFP